MEELNEDLYHWFWSRWTGSCKGNLHEAGQSKGKIWSGHGIGGCNRQHRCCHIKGGLDPDLLLETKRNKGKVSEYPEHGVSDISGLEVMNEVEYDCLVEVTPTNIEDGEPARTHILTAFRAGKDVVTSNKGPLALSYSKLIDEARSNGVQFKFEASVGGAMPILNFAHETLAGCDINSVFGILNGTTNFILSRMAKEGSSYEQTLNEAQQLGIAETNPAQDVDGIDAACKVVILANSILGRDVSFKDVEINGISKITPEAISLAKKEGYLIKLIGEASMKLWKYPHALSGKDHPSQLEAP